MIIKDWKCPDCGAFESAEPVCPVCSKEDGVARYFPSNGAPSVRSTAATSNTDGMMRHLADTLGFTDLSNKRGSVVHSVSPTSRVQAKPGDHQPSAMQSLHTKNPTQDYLQRHGVAPQQHNGQPTQLRPAFNMPKVRPSHMIVHPKDRA